MRKIIRDTSYDKIVLIKEKVIESILLQISEGKQVDFTINEFLLRLKSLPVKVKELTEIISSVTLLEAKEALDNYHIQNIAIEQDILGVERSNISENVTKFIEYIYNDILFYQSYWSGLGYGAFSKMIFKRDFFEAQGHCVCPYCDNFEDPTLLSFEIDHLLPKSIFPLLYVNEYNLIPCCQSCNHTHKGKGNRSISNYYSLFSTVIGDNYTFSYDEFLTIIGNDKISNDFSELLRLNTRYKEKSFNSHISKLKSKIFKDLKKSLSNSTFMDEVAPNYYMKRSLYASTLKDIKDLKS